VDKRHLTVLSWMVTALLSSQSLNQARWEPFVQSRAEQANSYQRRWNRFCQNGRVAVLTDGHIFQYKDKYCYVKASNS